MGRKRKKKKFRYIPDSSYTPSTDENSGLIAPRDKLFVYGIFLNQYQRDNYGMTNPMYATVKGFLTTGGYIVTAIPVLGSEDITLSGLLVEVPRRYLGRDNWVELDRLESAYKRIKIKTVQNQEAFMYVGKSYMEFDKKKGDK